METKTSSDANGRFHPEVERILRASGWYPGRAISVEALQQWLVIDFKLGAGNIQVRMFPTALRILREFGGLRIQLDSPGITCYRESFCFDPLAVRDSGAWNDIWLQYEYTVDGALFPLGIMGDMQNMFAVDGSGRIINDNDQVLGYSIHEALNNMILGYMPVPMEDADEICHEAQLLFPLFVDQISRK